MKIAYITNSFSNNGGVGRYLLRLSKALCLAGYEVVVIHSDENPTVIEGVKTYFVARFDVYRPDSEGASEKVLEILKNETPDIVHVHASENYSLEEKIRDQFNALRTMHVYEICPSGNKFHYVGEKVCKHKTGPMCVPRMVYKRCTLSKNPKTIGIFYARAMDSIRNHQSYKKVIVTSKYVCEQLLLNDFKKTQVEILPCFTELPENLQEAAVASDEKIILFAGRIEPEKGLHKLIEALAYIPNDKVWKLCVNGDGSDLKNVKNRVAQLGLSSRVEFLGWVDEKVHDEWQRKASVVVVPSIWPEPFGLVGIEAMSYAKPVIAFNTGGIPDWLTNEKEGYLIPTTDVKQMASKIEALIFDETLTSEIGRAGLARVKKDFLAEKHVEQIISLYKEVLNKHE